MFFLFKMYLKIVYIFDPILLCVDVFLDAIVVLKGLQSGRLQSPSSRAETKETPDQNQQHQPGDSEGEGTEVTQTHARTHTVHFCVLRCTIVMFIITMCLFIRNALLKMREVYEQSPQMGDPSSVEPRLEEVKHSLQRLEEELRRHQVLYIQ